MHVEVDVGVEVLVQTQHRAAAAHLKARLAENRATQPLFDTQRFRRHIEAAYATMWDRVEEGAPPESFAVPLMS